VSPHQGQDLRPGVIIVEDLALGGLPGQLVEGRFELVAAVRHDPPLGCGWQGDAQTPLQPFEAIERQSGPVLEQGNHTGRFRVILVFLGSDAGWRLGREGRPARVTA